MPNLGIHVKEKTTAVAIPVVADVGIPFVVGKAPVHAAASPAKPNVPVLCTSWDEAVEKLGFSYDWKTYTLCEFMYSHFQLYGCQPVIFCNVFDPSEMKKDVAAKEYSVADHKISLPFATIGSGLKIRNGDTPLVEDEDYSVLYDEDKDAYIVELLSSGSAYQLTSLTAEGAEVTPDAVITDVVPF